jgi:hypothetical protein
MKKMRITLMGAVVLAVLATVTTAQDASARVRVTATVRTPTVRVHIGNTPVCRIHNCTIDHVALHAHRAYYQIGRQDRLIAVRLARFTGVPSRELLRLRRLGYRWFEIGRWLDLPRPVIRAAMQQGTWKRFLKNRSWIAKKGGDRHWGRRVAYVDDRCGYDGLDD